MGVPELKDAYDPPFQETPRVPLPYFAVKLVGPSGRATPLIDCRLSPGDPFSIFPREIFQQLGVSDSEGIRARDPERGEVRLVLLELFAYGEDGRAVVTKARVGLPLESDPSEPQLGSFGFFSAFDVLFSRRRGIFVRGREALKAP